MCPARSAVLRLEGRFRKDEFEYDAETDSMLCPAGQRLQPYTSALMRGLKKINYAYRAACRDCPLRSPARATSFARCPGWKMKLCWIGWPLGCGSVQAFLTSVASWSSEMLVGKIAR